MTPEQKIVEAAVAWRRAQHEALNADEARMETVRRTFFSLPDYQKACSETSLKVDRALALRTTLTDLLDQYIQEEK